MACLHTLLDNGDRYYIDTDQQRPPWTIFVDSTGLAATDFGLTAQQQQTLFNNGQSAAKTWLATKKRPSHKEEVRRLPLAPALTFFEIAAGLNVFINEPAGPWPAGSFEHERLVPGRPGLPSQAVSHTEGGTGMGELGTNVATEMCGQVSVLKFKKTC